MFHMVKDKVDLYRDYKSIGASCLICGNSTHLHQECMLYHLVGSQDEVLQRYRDEKKNFAESFTRKNKRRFNNFLDLKEIQLRAKQYSMTESLKSQPISYTDISALERQKEKKRTVPPKLSNDANQLEPFLSTPNQIDPLFSKPSSSINGTNSDFFDMDSQLYDRLEVPKIYSENKDYKIQLSMPTKVSMTLQALFRGDLSQRGIYKKLLLEQNGISQDHDSQASLQDELVFDQVKNFQLYFPHNNLAKILEQTEYNRKHKKYYEIRLESDHEITMFKKKLGKIFQQSKRASLSVHDLKRKKSLFNFLTGNRESETPQDKRSQFAIALRSKTLA